MEFPEIATGVLIYNQKNKIFLGTGKKHNHLWTIPGGHVKTGETLEMCARREIKEETGYEIGHLNFTMIQESIFKNDCPGKHYVFVNYFASLMGGSLMLDASEFSQGRWLTIKNALKMNLNSSTRSLINRFIEHQNLTKPDTVVFVGHLGRDTNITSSGVKKDTIAGSGYLTAITASLVKRSKQTVGVIGRVGGDKVGKKTVDLLMNQGIDTEGIEIAQNEKSAWFTLIETGNTSYKRQFYSSLEAGKKLSSSFPEKYRQAAYIHLATAPPKQQSDWINKYSSQISSHTLITIDILEQYAKKYPKETLKVLNLATGYIFMTEEELKFLTTWGRQNGHLDQLSFSVPVILKQSQNGATIMYKSKKIYHVPAQKICYVNGSGAGETLAGVFLTLRAQGLDEKISLQKAVKLASLSVENFGVDHLITKV